MVIEVQEQPGAMTDRGSGPRHPCSDGRGQDEAHVDGGRSSTQTVGHLRMEGREVFKHAVTMITDVIKDAFAATGYTAHDLDWFVPHQANRRIIDGSVIKLGLDPAKVIITVDKHGKPQRPRFRLRFAPASPTGASRRAIS